MDPITANLTIKTDGRTLQTKATKMRFSPFRCFAYNGGEEDRRVLQVLAAECMKRSRSIAFYGPGKFFGYFLELVPEIKPYISYILCDKFLPSQGAIKDIPVILADELPVEVKTVFLCETSAVPLMRMQKKIRPGVEVLSPAILKDLDWKAVPSRAWIPEYDSLYPMEIPEIEFLPEQDVILIDCPARNLALMPNGLAYVHNALKKTSVKFQTIDLDILIYHRYHMHRLLDAPEKILTPAGTPMHPDPWLAEAYDEWQKSEVIEYFRPDIQETIEKLIQARPKILGLSLQACNLRFAKEIVKEVKEALPETVILVGGYSCYQTTIGRRVFPESDYMCMGEADLTIGPLVEALARGERPRDLPGVFSRYDSPGYFFKDYPMPQDLDVLEMANYEWTNLNLYRNYNHYQLTPIIASRGCKWSRCTFCAERFFWRVRSPQNVVDEFEYLNRKGCDLFMFNESDLNGKPEILVAICEEIARRGLKIKLTGQLRVHKNSNRLFFDKLRAGGFVALRFGVDAWSTNTLRQQMKGYTTGMIYQNLKDCWEAGIYTEVNTVIGVPGETEEDIERSIELMIRCKPFIGRIANINPLMLVIGSVYWEDPEKFKIRFRGNKTEIFETYPNLIPADLWYSEEPYIDQAVRLARFQRIVKVLHDHGFDVGSFAVQVIKDMKEGKGADHSARPDVAHELEEVKIASCEDPAAQSITIRVQSSFEPEAPSMKAVPYQIISYNGGFYGIDPALKIDLTEFNPVVTMEKRSFLEASLLLLQEKSKSLLRNPRRLKSLILKGIQVLMKEGVKMFFWKLRNKIKPKDLETLVVESGTYVKVTEDVSAFTHLITEGFHGYNIIQVKRDFYGIKQGFSFEKEMADRNEYPPAICFKGKNIGEVENQITAYFSETEAHASSSSIR